MASAVQRDSSRSVSPHHAPALPHHHHRHHQLQPALFDDHRSSPLPLPNGNGSSQSGSDSLARQLDQAAQDLLLEKNSSAAANVIDREAPAPSASANLLDVSHPLPTSLHTPDDGDAALLSPVVNGGNLSPSGPLSDTRGDISSYDTTSFADDLSDFGPMLSLEEDNTATGDHQFTPSAIDQFPSGESHLSLTVQPDGSDSLHRSDKNRVGSLDNYVAELTYTSRSDPESRQPPEVYQPSLQTADVQPVSQVDSTSTEPQKESLTSVHPVTQPQSDTNGADSIVLPLQMDPGSRRGVSPDERGKLNQVSIPSLEDQQKDRELAATKAGVEQWLYSTDAQENTASISRQNSTDRSNSGIFPSSTTNQISDNRATASSRGALGTDQPTEQGDAINAAGDPSNVSESNLGATRTGGGRRRPWYDSPVDPDSASIKEQPISSNAAMALFDRRAKDIETASQTATIASSRRSLESLMSTQNSIKIRGPPTQSHDTGRPSERKPGLLNRFKRSNSNTRKRKESQSNEKPAQSEHTKKESLPGLSKRVPSWASGKSAQNDSNSSTPLQAPTITRTLTPAGTTTAELNQPQKSPTGLMPSVGGSWMSPFRRRRSRSDIGQSSGHVSALAKQWAAQGGPPVPNLRPPAGDVEAEPTQGIGRTGSLEQADSDRDVDAEGDEDVYPVTAEGSSSYIIPSNTTKDGFKDHALKTNPNIEMFMLDRVTQEQLKRYRRLSDARLRHATQVKREDCPSRTLCQVLGNGPKKLTSRRTSANAEQATATFHIVQNGAKEDSDEFGPDDASIPATFPEGIPPPPVKKLPAEFECPICFHTKEIWKPSDWTKHVHEDLQPFTCSFLSCSDVKSFKRKADWVRHENERHRQLEKWLCNYADCQHICYRKDNFVQHLVREHKLPEPRTRAPKTLPKGSQDIPVVSRLVEECRQDTTKKPEEEPCRFCGACCNSWRKLSGHLAKHMEAISLPVLKLASQETISSETLGSPAVQESTLDTSHQVSSHDQVQESIQTGFQVPSIGVGRGYPGFPDAYPPSSNNASSSVSRRNSGADPSPLDPYPNAQQQYMVDQAYANQFTKQLGHSYPGTKNLQSQNSYYYNNTNFDHTEQIQNFYGQQIPSSYQNSQPDTPYITLQTDGSNTHSSTYPPAYLPSVSQPQSYSGYGTGSIYGNEGIYTTSPTTGADYSGNEYATVDTINNPYGYPPNSQSASDSFQQTSHGQYPQPQIAVNQYQQQTPPHQQNYNTSTATGPNYHNYYPYTGYYPTT